MAIEVTTYVVIEDKGTNPAAVDELLKKWAEIFDGKSAEERNVTKFLSTMHEDYEYTEENIADDAAWCYVEHVDGDSFNLRSSHEPASNTLDFIAEHIAKVSEKTIVRAQYDCDFIKHGVRIYDDDDCDYADNAYEWTHQEIFELVKSEHNIEVDGEFYEIEDQLIDGEIIDDYDEKYWEALHTARENFTEKAIATIRKKWT